jgi:hypothetical protein
MNKRGTKRFSIEFFLALAIASILIVSLIFEEFLGTLPSGTILILVILFVAIKLFHIIKEGGTVFEDYISLSIIILMGVLRYLTYSKEVHAAVVVVGSLILLYSVGLIPSVNRISKSKNTSSFIISYIIAIGAIIFLFAGFYSINSEAFLVVNEPTKLIFQDALYFSTMTFTTVGYGDIAPTGINKLISSIEAIMGIAINIAFIGYILASRRFKDN